MRYFDESEREKKERRLADFPRFLRILFNSIKTVHDVYDDNLSGYVRRDKVLLDAGCGKKGIMNKYRGRFRLAVGVDPLRSAMAQNASLDAYYPATIDTLPFPDECFDVVISQWVVEHLADPESGFRELHRVLKRGGGLILVTNSIYHPMMFFSSLFPESFRSRLKERVLPPEIEEDTFPTYYRCNTLGKMESALTKIGFRKRFETYVGDASFFVFSKLLFPLSLLYEKVTDLPFLRPLKMHVVVHYSKTE